MSQISHVVISIPAHNEATLLASCLDSVRHAVAVACDFRPGLRAEIVVALDRCTDGTGDVARARQVETVLSGRPGVGSARNAAIEAGLRLLDHPCLAQTWLACTDADTVVPSTWLVRQFMWAGRGIDLVLGTVHPDAFSDARSRRIWRARHQLREGHLHVHGANLGVRADQWQQLGGFEPLVSGEDVAFAAGVRRVTQNWVATDSTRVMTSGRLNSRVEGGFADYLKDLPASAQ
ncbi:MAG: glycosyltransferase family A protein [Ornithinimicrobium sp.]